MNTIMAVLGEVPVINESVEAGGPMAKSSCAGSPGSILLLSCLIFVTATSARAADPFRDQIQPFLKTYCFQCHNEKKSAAELNLTRYGSAAMLAEDFRQWEHVVTYL